MQSGKTQTSSKKENFVEFNLDRFKKAQSSDYSVALQEIKNGKKLSHWMWYIFPQLKGLGFSEMANYYGIAGKAEAVASSSNGENSCISIILIFSVVFQLDLF